MLPWWRSLTSVISSAVRDFGSRLITIPCDRCCFLPPTCPHVFVRDLDSRLITTPRGCFASSGSGFVRPRSGSGFYPLPPRRLSLSFSAVVRANVVDNVIRGMMMFHAMLVVMMFVQFFFFFVYDSSYLAWCYGVVGVLDTCYYYTSLYVRRLRHPAVSLYVFLTSRRLQ